MGLRLSITIVDPKQEIIEFDSKHHLIGEIVETDDLSPDDLHIGLINSKIIINNEKLMSVLDDTKNLSKFDMSLNDIYPNCEIVHILQYDTCGLYGYVIIDENIKQRCKGIIDGQLFMDDGQITEFEKSSAESIFNGLYSLAPKSKQIIEDKSQDLTEHQKIKYAFSMMAKLSNSENEYLSGKLDEKFIHKLFPYFINGDWSKLIGIEYVKYNGVDYDNMEIDLSQYVKDAINRLKNVSI